MRDTLTNTPLVSIIIPAYNHGAYLEESIESVLAQDYQNIELIVLNDGSTDETEDVLKKYKGQFYWETQQNLGQSSTLNKGWSMAKGDILGYLSADDILLPHAVSVIVNCLLENPEAVLCYGDFQLIDPESRVIRNVSAPEYSYLKMVTAFICAPGPGAFFRHDAFIKAGGWDPLFRQTPDYEYWLRLGLFGNFVHVRKLLAALRIHEGSQTFTPTTVERAEEALRIIYKYYQRPDIPPEILTAKNLSIANANLVVAQHHLRAGRYNAGFIQALKGIAISPKAMLSYRVLRMLINGLFNRPIHKLLWVSRTAINSVLHR